MIRFVFLVAAFTASAARADNQATLDALLTEVRELRLAVQRAAAVGPRLQLAMRRLDWQEQRVVRVSDQLANLRNRMRDLTGRQAEMTAALKHAEAEMANAEKPDDRKRLEDHLRRLKAELDLIPSQEAQLRAEEAEVAAQVRTEQAKADELAARIEGLERALTPPAQQPAR